VYDRVGFAKALFWPLAVNRAGKRPFGKDGVKGAYFTFITTLNTGLPKPTMELGTNLRRSF
jgi:hypothetical protein